MRRVLGLLVLAGALVLPAMARAGEQVGVYVAPKFIYGYTLLDGMKLHDSQSQPGDPSSWKIGDKTDSAYGGALAIGYDFNKRFKVPVRAELEYAAFSQVDGQKSWPEDNGESSTSKQKLQIQTLFVNAYYDFHNSTDFTPYVGGGIGMAFINTKSSFYEADNSFMSYSSGSSTTTNFAWNAGAGVAYAFTDYISLDAGYRFAGLGGAKAKWLKQEGENWMRNKTEDVYMHQVMAGLRITF